MRSFLRPLLSIFLILYGLSAKSQLNALFFFDAESGRRDIPAIQKGHEAQDHLHQARPDSAIILLRELVGKYPGNGRLYYHLAAAHADLAHPTGVKRNIHRWLDSIGTNAACLCLKESKYFEPYLEEAWMVRAYQRCWEIKRSSDAYHLGTEPKIADSIAYYAMIDQELLSLPRFFDGKDRKESDSLQWANFKKVIALIDTSDLPTREELGDEIGRITTFLRHLDHKPKFQVRMGERMIRDSAKGYSVRWAAILIDEGVQKQGEAPRYGVIAAETGRLEKLGDLEATNRRRKRIGLEAIEP
jgi:hypothetical protein